MKLNEDQVKALTKVIRAAYEIGEAHEDARKVLAMGLNNADRKMRDAVKAAAEVKVPKRQIQEATGIKSTGAFYSLLREAGVPIAAPPLAHLPKIRKNS